MHPKEKQAYDEVGFQVPLTPGDANETAFRRKTKRAKEEEVTKTINQIWRISQGPKKDFIFYEIRESAPDLAGNEDTLTTTIGRYNLPKFRHEYNNTTGDTEAIRLAGYEMKYEIPYSKEKMEEILDSGDSSNTAFTLIVGNRKYGSFTADDFINKSFDELAQIGLYGYPQPIPRANELEAQEERERELEVAEKAAAEEAKAKYERVRREAEEEQQEKEEARKRQAVVNEQQTSPTRTAAVEEKTTVSRYDIEEAVANRKKVPNVETNKVSESVNFVVKKEDLEADEDSEIAKGFDDNNTVDENVDVGIDREEETTASTETESVSTRRPRKRQR